ncbi:MAG: shikimate dehydrogenase [Leptolinea sp.]
MNSRSESFRLGLIGWPLVHSLSPLMHNAALKAAGLPGEYRLYPVQPLPEGEASLRDLLGEMKVGSIQGLNVTIPHKQNILNLVDLLSPAANAIGAVNTISVQNGLLTGDNTDWLGFLSDLDNQLPDSNSEKINRAVVLGAGGSARAVVYALQQIGWQVNISARRLEQSEKLATDFSSVGHPVSAWPLSQYAELSETTLIVNTTPVGMFPDTTSSPWPADLPFPKQAFLYDLIYNPIETALMKSARSAGLSAANGLGMLAEQAALAFEIWTGKPAPREIFRQAAVERTVL